MNVQNIDFSALFKSQSDKELNASIRDLVEARCDRKDMSLAHLETLACNVWKDRHPNTIAPCALERAMKKGGFPPCYNGPTSTIDLDEGLDK